MMTEEEIKVAVVELLYDLHAMNKLDAHLVNNISRNFKVDAVELCEANGITYNLN
jgi:hypothetical protein